MSERKKEKDEKKMQQKFLILEFKDGVKYALECVGGTMLPQVFDILATGVTITIYGRLSDQNSKLKIWDIVFKVLKSLFHFFKFQSRFFFILIYSILGIYSKKLLVGKLDF
jgi:hypothetical protein